MNYQTILTMKTSEKATVELAAADVLAGPVVIKRLKGGKAEIYRVIAEQENSHIPNIYAVEEQDEELLVAEEYIEGESLREYLQKNLLSDEEKIDLALQLCEAVGFLHALKPSVIHRDIKPSNLLINSKGQLKLIDFDASRHYKEATEERDTRLLGTVSYAPPEQFGFSQTDVRSDIYSMGVVLHEMCPSEDKVLTKQWERISEKCTSFDPKHRYQNVAELKRELERMSVRKESRKKRLLAVLLGGFMTGLAVFVVSGLFEKEATKEESGLLPTPSWTQATTLAPTVTLSPALTAVPTSEPTSVPTGERTKELLNELKEQKKVVEYFDKRREYSADFMLYTTMFEGEKTEFRAVELLNLETKESIWIPTDEFYGENRVFHLNSSYLKGCENGVYQLTVEVEDSASGWSGSISTHLWINEEEDRSEMVALLAGNYMEFYYEYQECLHVILSNPIEGKIKDVGTYSVLEDGRVARLDKEFLMQYITPGEEKKVVILITLEDGSAQELTVEMKAGKPYYWP